LRFYETVSLREAAVIRAVPAHRVRHGGNHLLSSYRCFFALVEERCTSGTTGVHDTTDRSLVPTTFAELGVPADLVVALRATGITNPFPVQTVTLPDGLAGHDLCGRAPTGSGKTLAFGIPIVARVTRADPRRPTGLVLVPTRELAEQVTRVLVPLARTRGLFVLGVYGGVSLAPQIRSLARGATIVVATPGRLIDLVERGAVDLGAVETLVLDEADRMADMGFFPQVRRLIDQTPDTRQTMLWSATLDGDVDQLIHRYQRSPRRHDLAPDIEASEVTHRFLRVDQAGKAATAAALIRRHHSGIVFVRTRHGVDRVVRQLGAAGLEAAAIHGARSQSQRERSMNAFRSGSVRALVATDVAARGIHVEDVGVVVHWDPVEQHKDYVHRSGRTGRAGATGTVVSLVANDARAKTIALQRALGLPVDLDEMDLGLQTASAPPATKHATHAPRFAPVSAKVKRSAKARRAHLATRGEGRWHHASDR
jgi:superfamily II DNA/RNA helicase